MSVTSVIVSAAIVVENERVLITQRKRGSHLEGLWEFPGGKVEDGEDPKHALVREMREELGLEVIVGDVVDVTFHRYETKSVLLIFYAAMRSTAAEPRAIDVAAFEWASAAELDPDRFPAADVAVLDKVRRLVG